MQYSRSVLLAVFLICCSFYLENAYADDNDDFSRDDLPSSRDVSLKSPALVNDLDVGHDTRSQDTRTLSGEAGTRLSSGQDTRMLNQEVGAPALFPADDTSEIEAHKWRSALSLGNILELNSRENDLEKKEIDLVDLTTFKTKWTHFIAEAKNVTQKLETCYESQCTQKYPALHCITEIPDLLPNGHSYWAEQNTAMITSEGKRTVQFVKRVLNNSKCLINVICNDWLRNRVDYFRRKTDEFLSDLNKLEKSSQIESPSGSVGGTNTKTTSDERQKTAIECVMTLNSTLKGVNCLATTPDKACDEFFTSLSD